MVVAASAATLLDVARATEVRDPLHGAIPVSSGEQAILDHPLFQRLRFIKQLGFADLVFPGATHVRYLHSVGAMHLAGQAFDSICEAPGSPCIPAARKEELRRTLRAAALLHDVGHPPFSHAAEFAMPEVGDLHVPAYQERPLLYPPDRRADHEDYTVKVITDSSLTPLLERELGVPAPAVAGLVDPTLPVQKGWYEADGICWRPLLHQLISSELDVDRLDYLARDSHFAGVHYGVVDVGWLLNHLAAHVRDDRAWLALADRAIYAFDDFLIARHHMFVMVYFHYKSVVYEEMLKRFFQDGGDGWAFPEDIEDYARVDDHHLLAHLRASRADWARRIVERREYRLLLERHGTPREVDQARIVQRLTEAGVPTIAAASEGILSKYFAPAQDAAGQVPLPLGGAVQSARAPAWPIWVLGERYRGASGTRAIPLEEATGLFDRYARQLRLSRIYVPPEDVERAGRLIDDLA